jgi:hypothetical protein
MKAAFDERVQEETYLQYETEEIWNPFFHFHYSIGKVTPCLLIDLQSMLALWRNELMNKGLLLNESFDIGSCSIEPDKVKYQSITAEKIFFCDGVAGFTNPFFKNLPYSRNKGEVLIAAIPGLPRTHLFKQGITIVPWKDDLFWIGSTYDWNYDDVLPTDAFRKKVATQLQYWLKLPYTIVDHFAAERPTNMERRPFVGLHPQHPSVGILNGMGTKGCSLAPYFAHQLVEHVISGAAIDPAADVKRFQKVLQRQMD